MIDEIDPNTWMQNLKGGAFCMVCGEYTAQNDPEGTLCRNRYSLSHETIWERMKVMFSIQEIIHGKTDYTQNEVKQLSFRARQMGTL